MEGVIDTVSPRPARSVGTIPGDMLKGPTVQAFIKGPVPFDGRGNIVGREWRRDFNRKAFVKYDSNGNTLAVEPFALYSEFYTKEKETKARLEKGV